MHNHPVHAAHEVVFQERAHRSTSTRHAVLSQNRITRHMARRVGEDGLVAVAAKNADEAIDHFVPGSNAEYDDLDEDGGEVHVTKDLYLRARGGRKT